MNTVRRSLVFAFTERYLIIGLQIASFALIARLLTPQQIGLYSVSLALISVAQVIRDFGIGSFLVQRKDLSQEHISSAFGLSMLLGAGLFTLVTIAAPVVGDFYNDASLVRIVRLIAFNFLILPFNSIAIALLRREMRFDVLMRLNVSAAVVGTFTTLGLAWGGFGSSSLAWGEIASNLTAATGAWTMRGDRRFPVPGLRDWKVVLSFGGKMTVSNIVTSISMDINDLVVGKIMGFTHVAMLSRAQGLMNLFHRDFMGTVRGVAFPAFARANREGDSVEARFSSSLTIIVAIAWPFYGFVAMFPLEILRLVFGPQWDAAAPLVPYFCIAGAFGATVSLIPTVMLAVGRPNLVALADLIVQPVKAVTLTAIVYQYRDLRMFVVVYMVISILAVPYFYAFKERCLPSDFRSIATSMARNGLLTATTLIPAIALQLVYLHPSEVASVPMFLTCSVLTVIAWTCTLWCMNHELFKEAKPILAAKFARKS